MGTTSAASGREIGREGRGGPWGLWRHLTAWVGQASDTFLLDPQGQPPPLTASPPAAVRSRPCAFATSSGASGTATDIRQVGGGAVKERKAASTRENDGSSWSMRCRFFGAPLLGPALRFETLEVGGSVVHEGHGLGQCPVGAGDLGDRPVHLLRDPPVRGVTLCSGPELNEVHALVCVELHDVTDAVRERDDVRRLLGEVRHPTSGRAPRPGRWPRRSGRQSPASATSSGMSYPSAIPRRCHSMVSIRWRCKSRKAP